MTPNQPTNLSAKPVRPVSAGRRRSGTSAAGARSGTGADGGHWLTSATGAKVYIDADGNELQGRSAYAAYKGTRQSAGGTAGGKKRKFGKKRKGGKKKARK